MQTTKSPEKQKGARIGKDGIMRVKLRFSLTERQEIFNRTGLTPPTFAWVDATDVARERRLYVHGKAEVE